MKKRSRMVAALLSAVLLAGSLLTMPLSVGAVTAETEGTTDSVLQNVKFSDILTEGMTSNEIAEKLAAVGIAMQSGNNGEAVNYAFENDKLVIKATGGKYGIYLNMAKDSRLKNDTRVVTELGGIAVRAVTGNNKWAFMVISGPDANCYKVQFKTMAKGESDYTYQQDPGVKAGGKHLTTDGSTESAKRLPLTYNTYQESVKTSMNLTVVTDHQQGLFTYINGNLTQELKADAIPVWQKNIGSVLSNYVQLGINLNSSVELESVCIRTSSTVFRGAQASTAMTDGTYSVRLVAVLESINYDAVGFEATVTYSDGETQTVKGTCRYAYTSIIGDGETYAAADFGGDYFVVLHVDGIPAEVASAEWNVRVYTVAGDVKAEGIGGTVTVNAPKA